VEFNNVNVTSGTDIQVDISEKFEATGTLNIPVGATIVIQPKQ